jgi:general stress protein YciG
LGRWTKVLRERQNREKEQRGGENRKKNEDREIVFETGDKKK